MSSGPSSTLRGARSCSSRGSSSPKRERRSRSTPTTSPPSGASAPRSPRSRFGSGGGHRRGRASPLLDRRRVGKVGRLILGRPLTRILPSLLLDPPLAKPALTGELGERGLLLAA